LASDRELCLEVGMNDHIAKPIDPHQLFGVLLRWIRRPGDDTAAEGDGAAAPEASEDFGIEDLELKGINVAAGLRFTGGNRRRYETLLRKFAERQDGAVDALRLHLANDDAGTAERAAHSLKGAAATLGAEALAAAAAETEAAIRTGRDAEDTLRTLSLTLDPVIKSIHTALPDEIAGNGKDAPPADPATLIAPLTRLKQLLESDDGEAADFIIDARPQLAGVLSPAEIKTLSDRVTNFEFEAALKCLSGIADRLSLSLEGT
jgi:HPt (histidine-containing phosphotransfer) domain-containing protein